MQRIKKDDKVVIIAGKNKGARGVVLSVQPKNDVVVVEGVNMATHHVKRSNENPEGGRVRREAPIHASNVMLEDPRDKVPTRVRTKILSDGRKVRVAVRSGEQIDK